MSVPERVCEECGAINRQDAERCWRCLALVEQPATTASTAGDLARERA